MTSRIVQITDCHLMVDPLAELKGIRTRERFERVISAFAEATQPFDRLVITGDLTHDERAESYEAVARGVQPWRERVRVIPGNHDDRRLLSECFADVSPTLLPDRVVFCDDVGAWRLVGLDSHVPGELHGQLGDLQLDWLDQQLRKASDRPTALWLHHPPIAVGSVWLDRIALRDALPFWQLLARHPQVRAVFTGHVHQELSFAHAGVAVFTSPSTGVQFAPAMEQLSIDSLPPGYRVVELFDNGDLRTRVVRVAT